MSSEFTKKSVLVVVGTTKFEDLIKAVSEERFQKLLYSKGYTHLSIQVGHGDYTPADSESGCGREEGLVVDWFRFKPTLASDMTEASLIISHGGSGTIFESLSLRKTLVVVINETLMNNHQTELASRLAKDGHLVYTFSRSLYNTIETLDPTTLVPYDQGQPSLFADHLDELMGFNGDKTD